MGCTLSHSRGREVDCGRRLPNCQTVSFLYPLRCSRLVEIEFIRGSTFVAPQVLVNVNHCKCSLLGQFTPLQVPPSHGGHDGGSDVDSGSGKTKSDLQEETFGPAIGIQKVREPVAET